MNLRDGQAQYQRQILSHGFTLVEVMMSLVVLSIGLMGGIGMLHWAERGLAASAKADRALSLAEVRIETKKVGLWEQLLSDDLDHDGVSDLIMHDDGLGDDSTANDGVYTASPDDNHIHLIWTVELNRVGPLATAGYAWIEAWARYDAGAGWSREIHLRTLRANPRFIGSP